MYDDHGGPSDIIHNEAETGSKKERLLSNKDSKFVGISIAIKKSLISTSFSKWNSTSPVQNPDINDTYQKCPLVLLFPDLRLKSSDIHAIVEGNFPPEDITRMLIGKRANFTHLKKSSHRQGYNFDDYLPTILEEEVFLVSEHKHRGNF